MEQSIDLRASAPGEFTASVTEGQDTTQHRIVRSDELLDMLRPVDVDAAVLTLEALRVLLEELPATTLPHDIDLLKPPMDQERFDAELARRLE